jgi:hypothetical protein
MHRLYQMHRVPLGIQFHGVRVSGIICLLIRYVCTDSEEHQNMSFCKCQKHLKSAAHKIQNHISLQILSDCYKPRYIKKATMRIINNS